ncbi:MULTISPECIES: transglycosylase domain-containing protein [Bacteroides]|uniref:transglycosylase domain-containing protein n=1 Tax=Bacteroides TaxID=816 RepID=UPI001E0A3834|nr:MULTISPECIES: transglycosylase domain-containing protein [Bacteroides]HJD92492.1 transglycosylase domain-containing protein [Bacteroides coprosuis]
MKKFIIGLWVLFLLGVAAVFVLFYSITKGWIGYMPPVEDLENPNYKFATQIISEEGEVLGTWSLSTENRVYTTYQELPQNVIDALIATEDVRFYKHSGVDLKALVRAVIKRGVLQQKNAGGGSTISQQLSKQLFSPRADNVMERLFQKPIEWVIAVQLERYYTKEEILTMYLNKFDFLNNAVGIKTAAHTYFGKEPLDLTVEESATLVGMCKNPSLYNPLRFNERSKGRRNTVLNQMRKGGYITAQVCDSLETLPLELNYHRVDHKEGLATYFREYLRGVMTAKEPIKSNYRGWQMQKFYEDSVAWRNDPLFGWCEKNQKKNGENYSIYTDGLKIYTSINAKMQTIAEEAVREHIGEYLQPNFFKEKKGRKKAPYSNKLDQADIDKILWRTVRQTERYRLMKQEGASDAEIKKAFDTPERMSVFSWDGEIDTLLSPMDSIRYYKHFLRTGFMAMDPLNGHVKAYVGGPNYTYFQYDMAMVGRRQIGSTIKPFLYALAMENGFTPCDQTRNVQQTLMDENGRPWTPRNASRGRVGEMVTLKWGLANSNNWISAYLMGKLNPYALVRLIHNFGVLNQDIQPTISLALGPSEISIGEMVSAYTAFANKGIRVAPLFVTRIEDSEGNIISNFTPEMEEVISARSSYQMLDMLRAVINEGTGGRVRRYGFTGDAGGKTGTSNDNADAWFMGFTPQLVGGVWVGGEDRDIHFDTMFYGQGAAAALPIWVKFFKKVYEDKDLGYDIEKSFIFPEDFDPCKDSAIDEGSTSATTTSELDELFY